MARRRTPDAYLHLALAGIGPDPPWRLAIAALALFPMLYLPATPSRIAFLGAALAIIVFLPRLRLPAPLAAVIHGIARSTIYIYLCSRVWLPSSHACRRSTIPRSSSSRPSPSAPLSGASSRPAAGYGAAAPGLREAGAARMSGATV